MDITTKRKKLINSLLTVMVFVIPIVVVSSFFLNMTNNQKRETADNSKSTVSTQIESTEKKYLLPGFPINEVPLYKVKKIESCKIFVNTDPHNTSQFNEKNYAYYNVVFETDASQQEFLEYYKNSYEVPFKEEFTNDEMVKGSIKRYQVTAAHYGSDKTAYLQVFLPDYQDSSVSGYFTEDPKLGEESTYSVQHEKSYGLLNQKNGEVEYTSYYSVMNSGDKNKDGTDDLDEFAAIEARYKEIYSKELGYLLKSDTSTFTFNKNDYAVTIVLSREHGRVYVTMRRAYK